MIIVLADDITGAAELAGLGLRFGFRVWLQSSVEPVKDVDLLVLYANTRSTPEAEAVCRMKELTKFALSLQPSFIYKKTDSVLRGHVVAELEAQLHIMGWDRALLLPVNPSLGRIIHAGEYYVNGMRVHEAGFAEDPEFPITTSNVLRMVRPGSLPQGVLKIDQQIPSGIWIGEAAVFPELEAWASKIQEGILPAGAASFFLALLMRRYSLQPTAFYSTPEDSKILFVSGTTFSMSREEILPHLALAVPMPADLMLNDSPPEDAYQQWGAAAAQNMRARRTAIMHIDGGPLSVPPAELGRRMALSVKEAIRAGQPDELLIEGGSTAYWVLEAMGWKRLEPVNELAQGVVRLKVPDAEGLHLTIKPGSYPWPPQWTFN